MVFALNYEGEDFCQDSPAWPNGTYLGQMHPYHSDFYRGYAERRGWDPCETWATDQRNSAIRGLRELGYTVTAPGAASTPALAVTPDPTPAPTPIPSSGDWTYFGPECPDAYPNCAFFASSLPYPYIVLEAYDDTNESFQDAPDITIRCQTSSWGFTFDGGGPWIALGSMRISVTIDEGERVWFDTRDGSDDLEALTFNRRDSVAIIGLLKDAERQQVSVRISAVSPTDVAIGYFDVTGLTTNLERMPC